MSIMTISPLQNEELVTKKECGEFTNYAKEGFDAVMGYCDTIDASIAGTEKKITNMAARMERIKDEIIEAVRHR